MPKKIWGIPLREFATSAGLLVTIGAAWATGRVAINQNSKDIKSTSDKVDNVERRLNERINRLESRLGKKIESNTREIIREIRRRR